MKMLRRLKSLSDCLLNAPRAFVLSFSACAVLLGAPVSAHAQSLDTIYTAGNGGASLWTLYFDVNTTTPITITAFDVNLSSAAGTSCTLDVYITAVGGTWNGNTTNASAWTLVASGTGTAAGANAHSNVNTSDFTLAAAGTYGVAIRYTGASMSYTDGNGANQTYTNGTVTLTAGASQVSTAGTFQGALNNPRVWNGTIYYIPSDPAATGACCTAAAACTFGTAGACTTSGGLFSGQGTSCTPNVCPHRGACCSNTNNACTISGNGAAGCAAGTTYQGDATTCAPNICPQGACCNNTTGACTLTAPTGCTTGTFQTIGSVCTPSPCPQEACCNALSGACTLAATGACASGSTGQGTGTTCNPNPCPQPPPPTNDECTAAIAVAVGVQTSGSTVFSTSSGAGLTATSTGSCTQTATISLGNHLDVWYSFVAPATTNYTLNTCGSGFDTIISIHSACPADQSNVLDCNDDSTSPATNVACPDSGLRSRIQSIALTAGQTYYIGVTGYNGASGAFNLIVNYVDPASIGSCCVSTTCTLADAANCSGTFNVGGTCATNPCGGPAGVCCRGATCTTAITSSAACTASLIGGQAAGAAFPSAANCNAAVLSNAPCCYADYNKLNGITVTDIFNFLTDWFAGSPYANVGGTGAPGPLAVQNIFDFLNNWFAGGC